MDDYITFFEQAPIDEAYIGKTDILLQVEEQFGIIKNTLKKGQDFNSKPEVQKLNRLIEKQFGMDIFCLYIEDKNEMDASTDTIGTKFDLALKHEMRDFVVGSQETGFRFKPGNNLCVIVFMSTGLILNPHITPAELTAVILHEIGHNFSTCLDNEIKLYDKKFSENLYKYLVWKASVSFGTTKKFYQQELDSYTNKAYRNIAKSEKKPSKFRGWIRRLHAIKYNFKEFCKEVFIILLLPKYDPSKVDQKAKKESEENIKKDPKRKDEVFADKFSAIYGYSRYQVKELYKYETRKDKAMRFIDKLFGKEVVDNMDALYQNYYVFDEHPATVQRANSMMNTLKAEFQKEDLDPKLKAILKEDIDALEKVIKKITTATKNEDERQAVRKAFYKAINEEAPDALAKDLEDEIERELDEGLKKGI